LYFPKFVLSKVSKFEKANPLYIIKP